MVGSILRRIVAKKYAKYAKQPLHSSQTTSWTRFGTFWKGMKIVSKADDPKLPMICWRHLLGQYFYFV
jgi:hypothetical protein